jgi:DinB superfamily
MNGEFNEQLDRLIRTPREIAKFLSGVSAESIRIRPTSEEFSILESVCHLRDIEVEGYSVRIRRLLKENNPQLPDIDGSRLATERDYNSQRLDPALEAFATARESNVEILRRANQNDLNRRGVLEGVGEITLHSILAMMVEHDEGHLDELRRAVHMLILRGYESVP